MNGAARPDSYLQELGVTMRFSPEMCGMLLLVCALAYVSEATLYLLYGGMAVYALRGTRQALQALTVSWLVLYLTPAFFATMGFSANMRWPILAIAAYVSIREFRGLGICGIKALRRLGLFTLILFGLAAVSSILPTVSALKILQFSLGAATIICSSYVLAFRRLDLERWYYNLFLFVTVASLPLYPTALGFFRNNRGFQGILNHPQAMGVFLAPLLAWLLGSFFLARRKSPLLPFAILVGVFTLFASQARTGLVAIALSCLVTVFCFFVFRKAQAQSLVRVRVNPAKIFGVAALLVSLLVFVPAARNQMMLFIIKEGRTTDLEEGFLLSRGFLIERSMENFGKRPLTGMGFGTPSDLELLFTNTLTSVPTEKGFLPSAILEETGVIGTLCFVLFFAALSAPIVNYAPLQFVLMYFAAVFVNFGEMIFFSFGGIGLYTWLMIGAALTSAIRVILAEYELRREAPQPVETDKAAPVSTPA